MRETIDSRDLCKRVFELDESIRFAALADRYGKPSVMKYKKGSVPLLSKEEAMLSIIQSTVRMGSIKSMIGKLGKLVYASAVYEKVIRATIPLNDGSYLLMSFEADANHESIILKKIMPFLQKHGLTGR